MNLELVFTDEVASPVFTKEIISGKRRGNESIEVILLDTKTGQKVTTGPLASAKVKIILVRGDYGGATNEYGEFEKNIVANWRKKKNLLLGDIYVDLKHGSGTVGKIRIKHDRNSLSNVKFRLGAMVINCPYEVKQALTDPFEVKDRRNVPKSLRPLSLTDNVWQLKNIRRKGVIHKRLESSNVFTVRDFLNMYSSNPRALQEGNAPARVGYTPQRSNTVPLFDDDGNIEFDNICYKPQPCEEDPFSNMMIEDCNFSIQDFEECNGSTPRPAYDAIYGAWTTVSHGDEGKGIKAKKRWMKLRTLLFSITFFMKKLGSCVGATLVG
ncbi:hypothetical protein L2E82_46521 [Cichorium intybus]|uniref:Uncharacterized protein n=1 Tax=Cichorium intybus TaxID=13427 RepID=A0ACB8YTG5_CICIN|nr:hypothetical protein L1887_26226 [Cichorium endivia]KAI3688731.1 hypothetical protein L2E82_46521 [Cichorium intybus]